MKYVFIGGGNNGHTRSDGVKTPYETPLIDKYIVKLSNKENPNLLFIGHANKEYERTYFKQIKINFPDCNCQILKLQFLKNIEKTKELVNWADIIYVGGGNSKVLLDKWNEYHFTDILDFIKDTNKIYAGISAGANVLFNYFNTDYEYKLTGKYVIMSGMNYFNYLFSPHSDEIRINSNKDFIKDNSIKALCLSQGCSIIIDDNKYELIKENLFFKPYAKLLTYDKKYILKDIQDNGYLEEL